MLREMSKDEAERTAKFYLCSDCWGHLIVSFKSIQLEDGSRETRHYVECSTPGCPCNGFVSKRFADMQEQKSRGELLEAKTALRQVGMIERKSEAEIMADLGF